MGYKLIFILIISITLSSCVKDKLIIEYVNISDSERCQVYFTANVNDLITRAGMSPLAQNRYVDIYINEDNNYIDTIRFQTNTAGVLSPLTQDELILNNGTYSFYCFSVGNKDIVPPNFENSSNTVTLRNGVDYLSNQILGQTISASTSIPVTLYHRCSQIVISFVSELDNSQNELMKIDSVTNVMISPPDTVGITMDFLTGVITPSTSISDVEIEMPVNGVTCQQILLPLVFSEGLIFSFSVYLNGNTDPMNFTAQLVLVDNKLEAGNSYNYSVEIKKSEEVVVNYVNVDNWTQVDENNKPIVPVLK